MRFPTLLEFLLVIRAWLSFIHTKPKTGIQISPTVWNGHADRHGECWALCGGKTTRARDAV